MDIVNFNFRRPPGREKEPPYIFSEGLENIYMIVGRKTKNNARKSDNTAYKNFIMSLAELAGLLPIPTPPVYAFADLQWYSTDATSMSIAKNEFIFSRGWNKGFISDPEHKLDIPHEHYESRPIQLYSGFFEITVETMLGTDFVIGIFTENQDTGAHTEEYYSGGQASTNRSHIKTYVYVPEGQKGCALTIKNSGSKARDLYFRNDGQYTTHHLIIKELPWNEGHII